MCGRYALYGPMSRLREAMLLDECPEYGERYNTAPQASILGPNELMGRVGQSMGPCSGIGKYPSIGAISTMPVARSWRRTRLSQHFARHRCLIPTNGFYECSR